MQLASFLFSLYNALIIRQPFDQFKGARMLAINLLSLMGFQFLALIMPGPDFFLVTRNALKFGWFAGMMTALGTMTGIAIYATTAVVGFHIISDQLHALTHWIALFGGCYLIYMAYQVWQAANVKLTNLTGNDDQIVGRGSLYRQGVLTNLSNPKVVIFLLSILPLFIHVDDPVWYSIAIIGIFVINTIIWFTFVSSCIGNIKVRQWFLNVIDKVERLFAIILFLFAMGLLYSFATGAL